MKNYFLWILIFYLSCFCVNAQISVLPGTSVTIDINTNIFINSAELDTFNISSGAAVINNGAIFLSSYNMISEETGSPISGSGFEKYSNEYNSPLAGQNLGGLGAMLNTSLAPDSLSLKRYHGVLSNSGSNSILRSFEFESEINSGLNATLVFNYDISELNGYLYNDLMLYQSSDAGLSWKVISGNPAAYNLSSATNAIDSISLFTLFPFGFKIDSLNTLSFYHGDSIRIYYTLNGVLNGGNKLKFEFSDETGNFSSPFILDSLPAPAAGSYMYTKAIPITLIPGTNYRLRLSTTDIVMISLDNGNDITIFDPLTSVNEASAIKYVLYPNPASKILYLQGKKGKSVIVSDDLGHRLMNVPFCNSESVSIDISGLPSGVYFLNIDTADGVFHERFIKN